MVNTKSKTEYEFGVARVSDLRIHRPQRTAAGAIQVQQVEIDGQFVNATECFWREFFGRFGITENVFKYFSPEEVFDRICSYASEDQFQYCIASHPNTNGPSPKCLVSATSVKR